MPRFPAIICAVLLVAPAAAAPEPVHLMPKAVQWFPTAVGTTWVLDFNGRELTERISAVEHKDGDTLITIEYVDGDMRTPGAVLRMDKQGVCRLAVRGQEYVEPYWLLKAPILRGESWPIDVRFKPNNRQGDRGTKTVGEPDVFELDGKRHPAIRIITKFDGIETPMVSWYAPGLGFVKQTGRGDAVMKSFKSGAK